MLKIYITDGYISSRLLETYGDVPLTSVPSDRGLPPTFPLLLLFTERFFNFSLRKNPQLADLKLELRFVASERDGLKPYFSKAQLVQLADYCYHNGTTTLRPSRRTLKYLHI
jgi:hypothetical protein